MRRAVEAAWADPSAETSVRNLWEEVFPGVYKAQFLDLGRLASLRAYLDDVADAGIPLRPPYGISLNRGGAMLDPRSEGYLAAPAFQDFYSTLMNSYMRPISRLLFPDVMGHDTQTFGFSIQWQADADTSLRAHTDASSVTLNINLNLPGEGFEGSGVRFFDRHTRKVDELSFAPGTALIHHGSVPHESMPITQGTRSNFVLWLYGDGGAHSAAGRHAARSHAKRPLDAARCALGRFRAVLTWHSQGTVLATTHTCAGARRSGTCNAPRRASPGEHVDAAFSWINCKWSKWRTGEDSNPRPLDS